MLDLAEALGAPVVDSDGRYAFPSTHPLNLTNAREEALQNADVVLALDVPSLGVPLGPSIRRRGNFAPIISPFVQSHSHHLARSRKTELGERQHVALTGACADRRGHGGGAAALARTVAGASLAADPNAAKLVAQRRAKVEGIYRETRKKSEELD